MSVFDSVVKTVRGIYTAPQTVTELTTGDYAVMRISPRRAAVTAADQLVAYATSSDVSTLGNVTVSTTGLNTGYAAATTVFFDGSDAGFGATARYLQIPAAGWRSVSINVYETLGVNVTIDLYTAMLTGSSLSTAYIMKVATATVVTGAFVTIGPYAGGSGASSNYHQCEALLNPVGAFIVALTPGSDPSTGEVRFQCMRRT